MTTSLPSGIDEAEVARLWRQLLTVFEASAEARDQVASDLPDQLPVDEALRLSAKYFVTGEPLDLTSNAVHSPKADGSIEIADCTDSSGPFVLGPTTAGFIATANLTPAGEVEITELDAVVACVQRGPAQAALDSYSLYLQAGEELWSDPRVDHPALGQYRTERAAEAYRAYIAELDDLDLLEDTVVNNDAVQRSVEMFGTGEVGSNAEQDPARTGCGRT